MVSTPTIRGLSPDRAGVRGHRPAPVFRALPALRRDAMAAVRTPALGQGAARHRRLSLRGLRKAHRRASQDADAGTGRMAGDGCFRRSAFHRLPPLGALFAAGLEKLAADRAGMAGGPRLGGDAARRAQHPAGRDMGRKRRCAGMAAAGGTPRKPTAACRSPSAGLFLTAGVDVQKDRIEVDVWAWGRGLESWLVDHIVIAGGPDDPACWDKLTALLGRTWACANGAVMVIGKLAIDTGYEAPAVYAWARKQGFDQVAPIKGLEGFNRATPVSGPTFVDATIGGKRLRRGARLWSVATATFKTETYRFLRLERPSRRGPGAGRAGRPRHRALARLDRHRMAEAAGGRTAGHRAQQARLCPPRMAEDARTQRGAGHPRLCPGGGLDHGRGSLGRGDLAAAGSAGRGGNPTCCARLRPPQNRPHPPRPRPEHRPRHGANAGPTHRTS